MRKTQNVPLLCVNTSLIAALYDVMLPERLSGNTMVQEFFKERLVPIGEQACVQAYNQSDGLVVLSKGLERYWRDLGVKVPIHVIPRSINPMVVRSKAGRDPYDARTTKGFRVVVVCRHVREKGIARLIDIFAKHIAPNLPQATFTLVGDGSDQDTFKARAEKLGIAEKCFWPGEFSVTDVRTWYAHGDIFIYASMSETYGQVVSEAMYCGLPVVAFNDKAGVEQQIEHERDGMLLSPGPDEEAANAEFGAEVVHLLASPEKRRTLAQAAQQSARSRVDPDAVVAKYYRAFEQARRHRDQANVSSHGLTSVLPLARWAAFHSIVGAFANIRPSATLNRHGRKQPAWNQASRTFAA